MLNGTDITILTLKMACSETRLNFLQTTWIIQTRAIQAIQMWRQSIVHVLHYVLLKVAVSALRRKTLLVVQSASSFYHRRQSMSME